MAQVQKVNHFINTNVRLLIDLAAAEVRMGKCEGWDTQ